MQFIDPLVAGVAACVLGLGSVPHDPPAASCAPLEARAHRTLAQLAAQHSKNLDHFLRDMALRGTSYSREFPDRADARFGDLRVDGTEAIDLIGAGAVLEGLPERRDKHFLDPTTGRGLGERPNARDWAFDGGGMNNEFSWSAALMAYEQAVTAPAAAARRAGQERLFVTLGHLTRLVQGCTDPAQTRNDPRFETERGQRVSALGVTAEASLGDPQRIDPAIRAALDAVQRRWSSSFAGYFDAAASFSNAEFFSDDTIFEGYAMPSRAGTGTRTETLAGQPSEVVTSATLDDPNTGMPLRLARRNRGLFFDRESLDAPEGAVTTDGLEVLAPAAVEFGAGLIDYFLRGRLLVSLDDTTTGQLEITNAADLAVGASAADLTMLSGGSVRLFYETVSGDQRELPSPLSPQPLNFTLAPGDSTTLFGNITEFLADQSAPTLPDDQRAGATRTVTVMFSGTIGAEPAVCASTIEFPDNLSVQFTFDVSNQVTQANLDLARDAVISMLPQLSVGTGNRVAAYRFGSSAAATVPFTDDFADAANRMRILLQLQNGRELLDGLTLAGNAAAFEDLNFPANRTVMIAFTIGPDTGSTATVPNTVTAIWPNRRPTMDEGLTIFVGDRSAAGRQDLSDISARAMRPFLRLDDWRDLPSALRNAIKTGGATL